MHRFLLDVRSACRLMGRQPAFSLFVILTLGVGMGAATAVFTLVQAVLLHALPFSDPDRLVWMYNARTERDRAPLSIPDLEDYQRDARRSRRWRRSRANANLTGEGDAERLKRPGLGRFLRVIGSGVGLGRPLEPYDEAGRSRVAVMTYGLWTRRFGGDSTVVGRAVSLNGSPYTVVGVLARGFVFPFRDAEIAVPLALRDDPRRSDRGANFLRVVARLSRRHGRAGLADLGLIAPYQKQFPDDDARKTASAVRCTRDRATIGRSLPSLPPGAPLAISAATSPSIWSEPPVAHLRVGAALLGASRTGHRPFLPEPESSPSPVARSASLAEGAIRHGASARQLPRMADVRTGESSRSPPPRSRERAGGRSDARVGCGNSRLTRRPAESRRQPASGLVRGVRRVAGRRVRR
jgi:hypothetical protein